MKRIIGLVVVMFSLSACAWQWDQLDTDYDLKSQGKSVFVMGVEPANFELVFWPGYIKQEHFIQSSFRGAEHADKPLNGYIVGDASAGGELGLKTVLLLAEDMNKTVLEHYLCAEQKTPVFTVPRGKVIYLGDIVFSNDRGVIDYEMTSNFEKASQFMDENYPNLAGRLEEVDVTLRYTTAPCGDYPMIIYQY